MLGTLFLNLYRPSILTFWFTQSPPIWFHRSPNEEELKAGLLHRFGRHTALLRRITDTRHILEATLGLCHRLRWPTSSPPTQLWIFMGLVWFALVLEQQLRAARRDFHAAGCWVLGFGFLAHMLHIFIDS